VDKGGQEGLRAGQSHGPQGTGILTSCSDYHIFLKLKKNRRQALDSYKEIVGAALENGIVPRCHLEDATRADIKGFVIPMINEVNELCRGTGVKPKIRLCDTMGYGLPFPEAELPRGIPAMLKEILDNTDCSPAQLEWHGHNDFHKVLANAVCAWLYGCASANGTFLGFGERTGNPPLEGLVFEWMGITGIHDGIDTTAITDMSEFFSERIKHEIPANYPFVGADFNTTRAGIHADGLTQNEEIYNIFDTRSSSSALQGRHKQHLRWHRLLGPLQRQGRLRHPQGPSRRHSLKNWIDEEYKDAAPPPSANANARTLPKASAGAFRVTL
jgi:isopropylmalate/homocitrate/citramalate synthase